MENYSNLEKLSNDLKNLFQNQNQNENQNEGYFDFEIICEQNQTSFKTHKSILSSRSQYFKSLFKSKMKEYQENKLILQDVSKKELEKEEKEKLQNQISNLINKIRFIDFSKEEVKDILKENLIPKQISEKIIEFQKLQKNINERELNQFIEKENQNSFIFKSRLRFNSAITSHKKHFIELKEWINDDEFFSKMKLGYSAKKDGFSSTKWHYVCDDKGKTLILIKTKDNFIFGGFTSVGFVSGVDNRYIYDSEAFIFSLRNNKNDRKPEKFPIKRQQEKFAIYYHSFCGPTFGAGSDFRLMSYFEPGYSNFGCSYKLPYLIHYQTKQSKSYLAGSYDEWEIDELETYFI
ncbi:pep-cterm sorting domain-containing protein [Anaeramoeba ignava]|uniref:Pep-cterm sorting domain-containing protein n=1 Tax=Anaeramoeba ignava TaxID=1746090 RepID=A0A9Q0LNJ7_ANAIG|nr:pep-cterm sorting domain-containing protein [Anaeramoeba ignava]